MLAELAALKDAVTALNSRVDALEQQLADDAEEPEKEALYRTAKRRQLRTITTWRESAEDTRV